MRHIKNTYTKNEATSWPIPNYWDALALVLVLGVIVILVLGAGEMSGHYQLGQEISFSLLNTSFYFLNFGFFWLKFFF